MTEKTLCRLYKKGKTIKQLAKKYRCGPMLISKILKNAGIKIRNAGKYTFKLKKNDINRIIKLYNKGMSAKKIATIFNVTDCTIRKHLKLRGIKIRKSYDHLLKGVPYKNDTGYNMIYINENERHLNDNKKRTNMFEHRLIMARFLGRSLKKHEQVHHINGKRDDNRLENLELWSTSQPPGQRVKDKIKWAKEILNLYKNYKL